MGGVDLFQEICKAQINKSKVLPESLSHHQNNKYLQTIFQIYIDAIKMNEKGRHSTAGYAFLKQKDTKDITITIANRKTKFADT